MHAFSERHGIEIIHAWGMTEMSPLGSVSRAPAGADAARRRGPTGTPRAGSRPSVEARIVGPVGESCPTDGKAVGELEVRGPWITASTSARTSPDPEKFRDGWLRTGDVGTLSPDGYLTLTDRAKDVIKSGGEWISSVELENALMAHPAVLEACVVGVPDERVGRAPARHRRAQGRRRRSTAERAARVPGRQGGPLAAAGALGVHRGGAEDQVGKFDKKVLRAQYADGDLKVGTLVARSWASRR